MPAFSGMKQKMYDDTYVQTWIKSYESRQDELRVQFIEPRLKKIVDDASKDVRILDAGCGWGTVVPFLGRNHKYVGVDPCDGFLTYIAKNIKNYRARESNITLLEGSLPRLANLNHTNFDVTICSMALHTAPYVESSIQRLLDVTRVGGKLEIIEFTDDFHSVLKSHFLETSLRNPDHYIGKVALSSGDVVETDVYFHTEAAMENALIGNAVNKTRLSAQFISYSVKKQTPSAASR